jgi:ketosteroid isomerase-like protein
MPSRGLAVIVAGLLLAPVGLAAPVLAQDATPAAECATTTEAENKELVRAFYAAAESGSAEDFADVLSADHVHHGPAGVEPGEAAGGAEGASGWVSEWQDDVSDLAVAVDPMIAEDDTVMALVTWSGTDVDTGEDASWSAAGVFRIECGKIAESWAVGDQLGRLMAIGDITADELTSVTAAATPVP